MKGTSSLDFLYVAFVRQEALVLVTTKGGHVSEYRSLNGFFSQG